MAFNTVNLYPEGFNGVSVKAADNSESLDFESFGGTSGGSNNAASFDFYIRGYSTATGAKSALDSFLVTNFGTNPTYNNLPLAKTSIQATEARNVWTASAEFRLLTNEEREQGQGRGTSTASAFVVPLSAIQFSSSGENEHIEKSEATAWTWNSSGQRNWSFNGLIDFNNGNIGGYDRITGGVEMTFSVSFPATWFSSSSFSKLKTYNELLGRVNSAPFFGFAVAEVLFQSFSVNPIPYVSASGETFLNNTNFSFLIKQNKTIVMPDNSTKNVNGHDYQWNSVINVQKFDGYSDYQIKQINNEVIYKGGDFNGLGVSLEQ